jgi:formate/nitrite transporter
MTTNSDAYSPREIAARVESAGVAKATTDSLSLLVLAVLAGAFISLGAMFFVAVTTGSSLGYGITRLIGGLAFSAGLIMVLVGGAELFTGNNLVAMAWASRLVSTKQLIRNWALVYAGNVAGALGTVFFVWLGHADRLSGGAIGQNVLAVGNAKADLGFWRALALGVLCNALVCMAVWLAMGGRTVTDRVLSTLLPVAAFVAIGFEHSVANWFFLPYAAALDGFDDGSLITGSLVNLAGATLGNILGGTVLVAGVYWLAYLRKGARTTPVA